MRLAALVVFAFVAPLTCQRVWTVDAANGPGTDFTDLPPAVAAAAAGDLLFVRQGTYTGFTTSKGLNIVSPQPSTLMWNAAGLQLTLANLPANETFAMHGFDAPARFPFTANLTSNAGRVVLSALRSIQTCGCGPLHQNPPSIAITDCPQVSLDGCVDYGGPAVWAVRSRVLITRCQLGFPAPGDTQGDCLYLEDSEVDVVDSVLDGRSGSDVNANPRPAVRMLRGTLWLRGTGANFIQGGWDVRPLQPAPAIEASGGALVRDGDVLLNPQAGANVALALSGTQSAQRHLAAALVRSADVGGTFRAEMLSIGHAPQAIFLSLPAPPMPLGSLGTVWLDATSILTLSNGLAGSAGLVSISFQVPVGLPRGLAVAVQGIADCGTGYELSSATIALLR